MDATTNATIMGEGDPETPVTEYTVTDGTETKTGYDTSITAESKVAANGEFTFTVKPQDYYKIDSVTAAIAGTEGETTLTATNTAADGTQTYKVSNVTGNVTIKVTASKIKYEVSVDYDEAAVTFTATGLTLNEGKGELEAAADLSLNFTAEAKTGSEITKVSYTMGTTKDAALTAGEDGKTYKIENINGNVAIKIESTTTCEVSFTSKANIEEVNTIKINGKDADPATVKGEGDWKIAAKKGDIVSFKLKAAVPYKVTKVTAGDAEMPFASGVYTLPKLEGDTNVAIETGLDPTQAYKLTVNLNGKADSAALVSVKEGEDAVEDAAFGQPALFKFTDPAASNVTLTIKPGEGYEVTSVKKGTVELTPEEPATPPEEGTKADSKELVYKIPFVAADKSKGVTVTVETDEVGLAEGVTKKVTFTKTGDHLAYTTTAKPVEGQEGVYTLGAGDKALNFTVTATGAYMPVVMRGGKELTGVKGTTVGKGSTKTTPYTYSVPATILSAETEGETISITEKAVAYTLTINCGTDDVELVVSVDGKVYNTPDDLQTASAEITYKVQEDTVVTVQATQKAGVTLTSLVSTVGTKSTTKKAAKGAAELVVTATDDIAIKVNTENVYTGTLTTKNGGEVPTAKNVYSVSYDGEYKAAATYGSAPTDAVFTKAEILSGKAVLETWTAGASAAADGVLSDGGESKAIGINIDNLKNKKDGNGNAVLYQGKTLTVNLYTAENGDKPAVSYSLKVSTAITSIKTKSASVKQTADTTEKYPLTLNKDGETAKIGELFEAKVADDGSGKVKSAAITDGELVLVTGTETGTTDVTVQPKEGVADVTAKWKVTVKVTPILEAAKGAPAVKLTKADDISLTLSLTAKNIAKPTTGAVWYEITATSETKADSALKDTVTEYVERRADTQLVVLALAQDGTTLGKGEARDYKVSARLVYTADKNKPSSGANLTVVSKASKETKFSTLKPAYETKLSLKKGTTTVTTGQTGVTVATAQFSKATTFTSIVKAEDSVKNNGLTIDTSEIQNNKIVVGTDANTALGTHTITVYALTDINDNGATPDPDTPDVPDSKAADKATNLQPVTAQIKVTVVKGINELQVKVPSYRIYKQAKKAATLKPSVVYNDGGTQPKKKNVEWSLLDKGGSTLAETNRLYGKVKINPKNGTITVDKSYVLSRTAAENQFKIKVTAKDFNDNTVSAVLDNPIEITNEALKIQTLALVKEQETDGNKSYKAIAVQDAAAKKLTPTPLEATEANGAQLVAFAEEVAKDKTWNAEDYKSAKIVASSNLSFKSSSPKEASVAADGKITVVKPKNGIKLTATVNDGSKAKADISINIGYDTVTDLSLKVEQLTGYSNGNADYTVISAEQGGKYSYSGYSYFKLTVQDNNTNAPDYTNYTVKAKTGAKVVGTNGNKVLLAATAPTAKVELTNNTETDASKKTKTYELINTGAPAASAGGVTIKTSGSFHDNAAAADQNVQLQMEKVKVPADANAVYAEVDQSARSAKNAKALDKLAAQIKLGTLDFEAQSVIVNKKEMTVVNLKAASQSGTVTLTPGKYKLKVTVGKKKTVDNKETFSPLAKTATVNVTVDKSKTLTFAPATAYTINTRESGSVAFTPKTNAKAEEYTVAYTVYNANISGEPNNFVDLFEVENSSLKLKADAALTTIPKNGVVGYLEYKVTGVKEYYANHDAGVSGLVKITVKVDSAKTKAAYTVDGKPEIGNKQNEATKPFAIKTNKQDAAISHAMAETEGWEAKAENGKVIVTYKGTNELPINRDVAITLYVVPENSYYSSKFTGTDSNAPTLETYQTYGVKLANVKIKAVKVLTPLEIAVNDVKAWVETTKKASPAPAWLTNDLTAASLKSEAAKALRSELPDNATATVEVAKKTDDDGKDTQDDDFTLTNATLAAAGKVEGNLKVTVGSESEKVAFSFTIPKGQITKAEAVALIKAAESVTGITVTNDDKGDAKAAKEEEICDAATEVIKGSPYIVGVSTEKGLTISQEATADATGKATITLLVKSSAEDTQGAEAALEYTIATIPATTD